MKKNIKKTLGLGLTATIVVQAIAPVAMATESTGTNTTQSEVDLSLSIQQEKDVDIVLTLGNTKVDATKFEADLRKLLTERGIDSERVNIQSVEAVEENIFQGKFAMNIFWPNNGADIDSYVLFGDNNYNLLGQIYFENKEFYGSTLDRDDLVGGVGEWATINFETLPDSVQFIEFHVHAYAGASLTNLRLARTINGVQEFVIDTQQMIDNKEALTYFGSLVRNNTGGWDFVYTDGTRYSGTQVTINSKDFAEVIRQPEWRGSAEHFLVNLDDTNVASLDDPNTSGEVLTRLMNEDIHYVSWGTDANKAQAENFIQRNSSNGTVVDNSDYSKSLESIADYVVEKLDEDVQIVDADNPFVLAGLPVRFQTNAPELNSNTATAEFPNGRWKLTHEPNYFENSEGTSTFNGIYRDSLPNVLDKPGMYELNFGTLSPEPQFVYAHRKPIANFGMNYTVNENGVTVTVTDNSYDMDHQTSENKGIVERKWRWKETTATTWNDGELPANLPANKHYIVQLQVKDVEGTWSLPMTNYITTDPNVTTTPIANFTLSSNELEISEKLVISDASYDPAGKAINSQTWTVYKGEQLIYTGSQPLTDFSNYGLGDYTIKLQVNNANGTSSEEFSRHLKVSENAINDVLNDIQAIQEQIILNRNENSKHAILNGKVADITTAITNLKDATNRSTAQNALNALNAQLGALQTVEKLEQSIDDLSTLEKINEALARLNEAKGKTNGLTEHPVKTALLERINAAEPQIYEAQANLLEEKVEEVEEVADSKLDSQEKIDEALALVEATQTEVGKLNDSPKKSELVQRLEAAKVKILEGPINLLEEKVKEVEEVADGELDSQEKIDEALELANETETEVKKVNDSPKKSGLLQRLTDAKEKILEAQDNLLLAEMEQKVKKVETSIDNLGSQEKIDEALALVEETQAEAEKLDDSPKKNEFLERLAVAKEKILDAARNPVKAEVIEGFGKGGISLTWPKKETLPEDVSEPNTTYDYKIVVKKYDEETDTFVNSTFDRSSKTTEVDLQGLTPGRYQLEIFERKNGVVTSDEPIGTIVVEVPVPEEPAVPTVQNVVATSVNEVAAKITWDAYEGAKRYRVQAYVKDPLTGEFMKQGFGRVTSSPSITLTNLTEKQTYKYEVTPYVTTFDEKTSGFSNEVILSIPVLEEEEEGTSTTPPVEENVEDRLNVTIADASAHLSWVKKDDEVRYRTQLYVQNEAGLFEKVGFARAITETKFTYNNLTPGLKYKFEVVPRVGFVYDESKAFTKILTMPIEEVVVNPTTPTETPEAPTETPEAPTTPINENGVQNISADMQGKTATITWDELTVNGTAITSYRIKRYIKNEQTGEFKFDNLTRAASGTSYKDTYKLKAGETYRYELIPRVGSVYNEMYKGTADFVNP